MEITVDERIELLTVVQTLCNYWDNLSLKFHGAPLFQCKYKNDIKEYFEKYKNHEIIEFYNILSNEIVDISAPIKMILCYSNPPELNNIANNEDNFRTTDNSIFHNEELVAKLRKFYADTNFDKFYKKNQNEYIKMLGDYGSKTELSESTALEYLGCKAENYHIIISTLVPGNFGIKVITDTNETLHYSVVSPFDYRENKYDFGPLQFKKEIVWHEIGHLVIDNDLTKNYINQFNINKKPVPEVYVNNFYTSIENIINEYIIRAITIRLVEMNGGMEIMEFPIEEHIRQGFKDVVSVKEYIKENCEENGKFIKDSRYKNLIEYVMERI